MLQSSSRKVSLVIVDKNAPGPSLGRLVSEPDPDSDMGPVIDKVNVARIDKMVEQAIAEGAKVILRDGPITDGPLAKGALYRPMDPKMTIVQKEVLGLCSR